MSYLIYCKSLLLSGNYLIKSQRFFFHLWYKSY